jgi:hypothetical protein
MVASTKAASQAAFVTAQRGIGVRAWALLSNPDRETNQSALSASISHPNEHRVGSRETGPGAENQRGHAFCASRSVSWLLEDFDASGLPSVHRSR